jgi:hypothetical protein
MAPVLRPRTFFATLLPAAILVSISAVALLSRQQRLFPLIHLSRVIVAAETLVALLLLPLLIYRFREPNPFYALITDSLMAFAVSIPFAVLCALAASLNLWSVIVSQFLYLAMILLGATFAVCISTRIGISFYLVTVFFLTIAVPLVSEIVGQLSPGLNLSGLSPIVISIQTVSDKSVSLSGVASACICLAVAALLWRSIILQRKMDKTL